VRRGLIQSLQSLNTKNGIFRDNRELVFTGRGVPVNQITEGLEGWKGKVNLRRLIKATVHNFANCGENMKAWM
jgi:hypothetical protein